MPGLCVLLALAAAILGAAGATSTVELNAAIDQANKNAQSCQPFSGCLGALVTLKLTHDVVLPSPLNQLQPSANLLIIGACTGAKKTPRRCVIDGAAKYQVFSSIAPGPDSPFQLELRKLTIQNAKGGVFANLWGRVVASDVVFQNNTDGVTINNLMGPFPFPPHSYSGCSFLGNNGTAITAGDGKYGLSTARPGITLRNSVFKGNRGSANADGGAVHITGTGLSLFDNVQFQNNVADGSGGAVFGDMTNFVFHRVTFSFNQALTGGGGAVAGRAGSNYGMNVSFCSCSFSRNSAPRDTQAASLNFTGFEFPGEHPVIQAFCGTSIPPGSRLVREPHGTVITGNGRTCQKNYC